MFRKTILQNTQQTRQADKNHLHFSIFNKPVLLSCLVFIILASLFTVLIFGYCQLVKEDKEKEAIEIVHQAKDKLQEALTQSLSATKILAFLIDKNGELNNFDSIAAQILQSGNGIDAVQLVPDGIIKHVYPLTGNENIIGYNVLKDSLRNKEAYKAIEQNKLFFGGPFKLKQNGMGVVGRLPVFRQNKFWGFSAVVIKMSTLYKNAGIDSLGENGYYFQLSKLNPENNQEQFFLPIHKELSGTQSVSVYVPDGAWKLSVSSSLTSPSLRDIFMMGLLGLLLSLLAAFFVYRIAVRPKKLNKLVLSRTSELRNSENKYRSLIEQASDGIVITDKEGIILEVNKSIQQMIGIADNEMIGYHLTNFLPEEDLESNPLRIHELMQGKSLLYERRLKTKDGSYLDVEINSKMASPQTLIGFIRDITERKKYENRMMYQASLLESVSDAVTSLDINRCIVTWNNACKELYGFTADEVIGKRIPELVTFEYPDSNNEEVFKKVFSEGKWKGEFNFMHPKTNEKFYLLSNINLLKDNNGKVSGFIITSKNITDRIQAEEKITKSNERFQLIAHATNDAIWDHDFNKDVTWGNKNLYNLYGVKPGDKTINFEMFIEHIHPAEREGMKYRMNKAFENQGSSITEQFRFRTADGEYRVFYDRANIKYNKEGKPLRIVGAMQDITDTEKFKQQLIKEKELSDSIINSLPGIFYLFTAQGKYLRWNKSLETITGYTSAEINNMHPINFFAEDEKEHVTKKIANVFEAGEDYVEAAFVLKNGQKIPYYFTGRAINYEGQICLMGVGLDFSDKQKAEKAIQESEEKYRVIIEQASDGIFMADADTRFIDVNTVGCRLLGYTLAELKGIKFIDIIPEEDKVTNPVQLKLLHEGQSVINERRLIRKDGTLIDVEISAKLLFDGRYQSIIRDITERKRAEEKLMQSEQKYKLIFNNNPLPMWMTSLPGLDIIDVNEAAIKQYGYSREEFLKLNTRQLRPAEDLEYFLAEVGKMLPDRINLRIWRHKRKDGSVIHVETYSHEIIYEGQRAWLGLSNDITEKTEAKELLQKSYNDIRELASSLQTIREDERTKIAREIHDELGQQLTGLKMDLHWLSKKINSHDAGVIKKMSESKSLINSTIATVRKIATDLRPSILDDLGLLAALEWQGEEFEKRSGTSVTFINKAGDVTVKPEIATAIFRIYQELLTNIARHAQASEVKVELAIDKNRLNFNLQDNGIGFDTDEIKKKKTLGLLGIKERTLLLGGTYEFKSTLGKGSVACISIPLGYKESSN